MGTTTLVSFVKAESVNTPPPDQYKTRKVKVGHNRSQACPITKSLTRLGLPPENHDILADNLHSPG